MGNGICRMRGDGETWGKTPTQTARLHLKNVVCNILRDEYVCAFSKLPLPEKHGRNFSHVNKKITDTARILNSFYSY
jgi:hypothetical protein